MNKVILTGRLTADPEIYQGEKTRAVRYTLAVGRNYKKDGEDADFISCVAFQKGARFAEQYLQRGMKILVTGRLQTGSYVNKDGKKVYTTDVIVSEQEFAGSREKKPFEAGMFTNEKDQSKLKTVKERNEER